MYREVYLAVSMLRFQRSVRCAFSDQYAALSVSIH